MAGGRLSCAQMATAAEPQPAQLPLPGRRPGSTVRLHPLLSGTALSPPAWFAREEGRLAKPHAFGIGVSKSDMVRFPIVSFLVEHPGAGPVLIDTGLHGSCAVDPKQNLGRVGARAFGGLEMDADQAVVEQLRTRGIEPGDVRLVVMTHLHIDHASAMSDFPNATFVFSKREWEAATEPRGSMHGYRQRQFDHGFDYRTLDFEGSEGDSYATFGRSFDLLGDGSVRVVYTPGHTHGHMSVILRLRDREALVAGDAIYTRRALETGERPFRMEDEHLFGRSLKEIQLFSETRHDALVIPGHDLAFWKQLDAVYE
jgi:glyoxylase-like metal-dependent hydrolase (beta-lactamase superfamily II)